jgi:SOS-response transcriptional repressor LexA
MLAPHQSAKQPLNRRQTERYNLITKYIQTHGFSPTFQELAERMGVASTNTVRTHLEALRKKGYIRRSNDAHRNIEIVP